VKRYWSVISTRFRMLLQYRAAALAGVFTQSFWGFVRIMILEAFYRSNTSASPMNLTEMAAYVWLGQALLAIIPWNSDPEVRSMVRTGSVAYELARPIDLYGMWYARAVAIRTAPTLLRAIPMTIFAMLVLPMIGLGDWRLTAPPSSASALAFLIALVGAIALSCAFTMLVNLSVLWTLSPDGFTVLAVSLVILCSGMVVPLPLFPHWSQWMFRALPFAGMVDLPFRLYSGNLAPRDLVWVMAHQWIWVATLVLLGRWWLAHLTNRMVVQGG
jgi:ABC-2 type transport system permease protein